MRQRSENVSTPGMLAPIAPERLAMIFAPMQVNTANPNPHTTIGRVDNSSNSSDPLGTTAHHYSIVACPQRLSGIFLGS